MVFQPDSTFALAADLGASFHDSHGHIQGIQEAGGPAAPLLPGALTAAAAESATAALPFQLQPLASLRRQAAAGSLAQRGSRWVPLWTVTGIAHQGIGSASSGGGDCCWADGITAATPPSHQGVQLVVSTRGTGSRAGSTGRVGGSSRAGGSRAWGGFWSLADPWAQYEGAMDSGPSWVQYGGSME